MVRLMCATEPKLPDVIRYATCGRKYAEPYVHHINLVFSFVVTPLKMVDCTK